MKSIIMGFILLLTAGSASAADTLFKPYFQAASVDGDMAQAVATVKQKLTAAGFEVVGEVSPYAGTTIVVVTNNALKSNAAKTDYGVFGAGQRVTITKAKNGVQIVSNKISYLASNEFVRLKGPSGNLFAIGKADHHIIRVQRVLNL